MGLEKLKDAIERYEKATKWIEEANPKDVKTHHARYLLVVAEARIVMDEYTKTLGYDPFENYDKLLKAIENI